jgi:hypothetical protein
MLSAVQCIHFNLPTQPIMTVDTISFRKMCETVLRDHLCDNIIHRSYFNDAAGINSNREMVFEHLERTVYVPILTLTAAVIKSFKKDK